MLSLVSIALHKLLSKFYYIAIVTPNCFLFPAFHDDKEKEKKIIYFLVGLKIDRLLLIRVYREISVYQTFSHRLMLRSRC